MLTGGGSGGHITPTAAVAKAIRSASKDTQIRYIGGTTDKIARSTFKGTGLADSFSTTLNGKFRRFVGFKGLQKLKLWKSFLFNLRDVFGLGIGCIQAIILLLFDRPNVVFSKGGSPALPVCIAAVILRIPIVTHDSDAVPGLTHRYTGRYARYRLFGVKPAKMKPSWEYVGIPLSRVFETKPSAQEKEKICSAYSVSSDFILVTGGGLGSRDVNLSTIRAAALSSYKNDWLIVSGDKYYEMSLKEVSSLPRDVQKRVHIVNFSSDMPQLIRSASVVITRAGATALAEVSAAGAATVIIPNPALPGGHQVHNAQVFMDTGAALIVKDTRRGIDPADIASAVSRITSDNNLKSDLQSSIKKLSVSDSADKVASILLKVSKD